ncbi:MAG: hypothetical protein ACRDM2_04580 [Gaiellaceae bacterium]
MQTGEVGIEITPILDASSVESKFAAQLDVLLRRTCQIARALTGAGSAHRAAPPGVEVGREHLLSPPGGSRPAR